MKLHFWGLSLENDHSYARSPFEVATGGAVGQRQRAAAALRVRARLL